jgi:hypothetical protein
MHPAVVKDGCHRGALSLTLTDDPFKALDSALYFDQDGVMPRVDAQIG